MFGFYHTNAEQVLKNPNGHLIIDDGRRYLRRTREKFDVIVIDPPPPAEAAGSSLLYSRQFYELARQHLKPHGILQAWFPGAENVTKQAVVRSIHESFPYVRSFPSVEGYGLHLLASMEPLSTSTRNIGGAHAADAQNDLMEWSSSTNLPGYLGLVVSREEPIENNLKLDPEIQVTDDDPINEYFLLRELGLFVATIGIFMAARPKLFSRIETG